MSLAAAFRNLAQALTTVADELDRAAEAEKANVDGALIPKVGRRRKTVVIPDLDEVSERRAQDALRKLRSRLPAV